MSTPDSTPFPSSPAPADDPTAALEQIRKRYRWNSDRYADPESVHESVEDIPVLASAIEAVLAIHHPVDRGAGAHCKGCATHVTFTRWPCPTYLAITRELTGGAQSEASTEEERCP